MAISYRDFTWENKPSTSTPTSAANFNAMEAGIKAACDELDARPVIRAAALTSDFAGTQENTTLEDVPGLSIAVAANEILTFQIVLSVVSGTTADYKYGLTKPSGSTLRWSYLLNTASGSDDFRTGMSLDTNIVTADGQATAEFVLLYGTLINSTTPGALQVQVAQATSNASDITVKVGSIIRAEIWT